MADDNKEPQKTQKPKAPPADPQSAPAAGAGVVDVAQTPARLAAQDDRTKELLRIVNGGERQLVGALEQLALATKGAESGASELYEAVRAAVEDGVQAVRNASMNHAIFMEDNAG